MATRSRIAKQHELSTTPASIIYTNASNEQTYLAPSGSADLGIFYDFSANTISHFTLGAGLA